MPNDSVYTLPAEVVQGFAVRVQQNEQKGEEYVKLTRVFRTYPEQLGKTANRKEYAFFEQLNEGTVVLLRRQQPTMRTLDTATKPKVYDVNKTTFYLSKNREVPVALRKPKRDLPAFFPKQAREIIAYAKENNLRYTNARELAFIVNYANSLSAPKP